jgi:hypothetical protein
MSAKRLNLIVNLVGDGVTKGCDLPPLGPLPNNVYKKEALTEHVFAQLKLPLLRRGGERTMSRDHKSGLVRKFALAESVYIL